MPVLTIIAGPNGSGKSTLTQSLNIEGRARLLDPDAIARRLNPSDPAAAAISAGREVLQRIEEYLRSQASFAVETTLASRRNVDLIQRARSCGFEVHLVFVGINSPEKSMVRIRNRVSRGGHWVPDTDVRRRYARSLANAADALRSADFARVYDRRRCRNGPGSKCPGPGEKKPGILKRSFAPASAEPTGPGSLAGLVPLVTGEERGALPTGSPQA